MQAPALDTAASPARSVLDDPAFLDLVDDLVEEQSEQAPRRRWRRALLAVVGVALVLVASTTAVLTALRQSDAADTAATASRLADTYQDALYAATVEQSIERARRVSDDPRLAEWHTQAGGAVETVVGIVGELLPGSVEDVPGRIAAVEIDATITTITTSGRKSTFGEQCATALRIKNDE